jgi:hypothetical protein
MGTTLADLATVGCWLALSLLGVLCGALQRRGRDYYPANLLLGLALGSQGVFYLAFVLVFRGDVAALRAWAAATRAALWIYGGELTLALWALWLVWRVNRGRRGSSADITGHLSPPTPEMVAEAVAIVTRAERHGMLNEVTARWLAEDRIIRRRQRGIE